jgi:hypothetical protein
MIGYLRLHWKKWRLEQRRRAADRVEDDRCFVYRQRIEQAQSDYLVAKADWLQVPVPSWSDGNMWVNAAGLSPRCLSREGIQKLRSDIRAEKKARAEPLLIWVPGLVWITGIIVALTGLMAVIGK